MINLIDIAGGSEAITNYGVWIIIILTIIQISPIKVDPWKWLARKIGGAVNSEVIERVNSLEEKMQTHIEKDEEGKATRSRIRVLRFNDEILHDIMHSKEHFEQILGDIKAYEMYCESHPNYENDKAVFAIAKIRETYQQCLNEGTFI